MAQKRELEGDYVVALRPDDYRGLKVCSIEIGVDDALVEHRLKELLSRVSFEDVCEPASAGDVVTLDYRGSIGDDQVEQKSACITLGLGEYLKAFEDAVAGRRCGDEFSCDFEMPPVHVLEGWQNASAHIEAAIVSARRPLAYEETDEYVASVSDFSTVQELKEAIFEQYQNEVQQESLRLVCVQLAEKLGLAVRSHLSDEQLVDYAMSHGFDDEAAFGEKAASEDEHRQQLITEAAFDVAWRNVARIEGISVREEDVCEACDFMEQRESGDRRSSREVAADVRDNLLCDAVMSYVLQEAFVDVAGGDESAA